MAILSIVEGERPKAPIFAATCGYARELRKMATSCWKEDPGERSTVDYILTTLSSGVEQWKPKHRALLALPPQDDWSPTLVGRLDSPTVPEHENSPVTTTSTPHLLPHL